MQMQRQKASDNRDNIKVDRALAQQIRRNMITKIKPSGKIYKRNGKKDIE
jgi:hypothetical protein